MHRDVASLSSWDPDDLVQEVLLRAITKLDMFEGRSSLKTWVVTLAKRHLITMARTAALKPRVSIESVSEPSCDFDLDEERRADLRSATGDLLGWLRETPDEVEHGWEVLNLLLWNHGQYSYVALAMAIHTGESWTEKRVRSVIRSIKETPRGRALCAALLSN